MEIGFEVLDHGNKTFNGSRKRNYGDFLAF